MSGTARWPASVQWENSEPSYGQGAKGYAERYGVRFADGTIENFMTKAIFPSVLHQDPRYFQSGQGGFMHRTMYAVSRIFVTREFMVCRFHQLRDLAGISLADALFPVRAR